MGDKRRDSGEYYPGGRVIARPGKAPQQIVVQWTDVQGKPQIAPLPDRYRESDMKGKINEIASKFATAIAVALVGWTALAGLVVQKAQKDQIWNNEEIVTNVYYEGEQIVDTNAVTNIIHQTVDKAYVESLGISGGGGSGGTNTNDVKALINSEVGGTNAVKAAVADLPGVKAAAESAVQPDSAQVQGLYVGASYGDDQHTPVGTVFASSGLIVGGANAGDDYPGMVRIGAGSVEIGSEYVSMIGMSPVLKVGDVDVMEKIRDAIKYSDANVSLGSADWYIGMLSVDQFSVTGWSSFYSQKNETLPEYLASGKWNTADDKFARISDVLAVQIDTNALTQIGEMYALFENLPVDPVTGGVSVGALLAALAAAVAWLKKNAVTNGKKDDGSPADQELHDFFTESNSLLNGRLAYSRNATGLKDRAFNTLSFDGTEFNLSTALAAVTPTASGQPRDLLIVATATAATTISFTAGTIKGDKPTIDGSGTWLITLTEYASGVWYCRQIKMEDAA